MIRNLIRYLTRRNTKPTNNEPTKSAYTNGRCNECHHNVKHDPWCHTPNRIGVGGRRDSSGHLAINNIPYNRDAFEDYYGAPRDQINPRRRHRAPRPAWIALALTLAAILAIALTATPTTHPSPSHQPTPNRPGDANLTPLTGNPGGYTYPPRTP